MKPRPIPSGWNRIQGFKKQVSENVDCKDKGLGGDTGGKLNECNNI